MKDLIVLWMIKYGNKDVYIRDRPSFLNEADYKVLRNRGLLHVENECHARLTSKALNIIKGE